LLIGYINFLYQNKEVLLMKFFKLLFLVTTILISSNSFAAEPRKADGYDVLADTLIVRPLSFVGMIVGSALYAGLSPLTAIATIPAPHNAFKLLADVLIIKPAKYTFNRPVGDYNYNEGLH